MPPSAINDELYATPTWPLAEEHFNVSVAGSGRNVSSTPKTALGPSVTVMDSVIENGDAVGPGPDT